MGLTLTAVPLVTAMLPGVITPVPLANTPVRLVLDPEAIVAGLAIKLVMVAADATFTVTRMVVVADNDPEVPLMVTVDVPVAAVALAVRVSVLLPVVEAGLKDAVTPAGNPEAARLTLPENPFSSVTLICDVAVEL